MSFSVLRAGFSTVGSGPGNDLWVVGVDRAVGLDSSGVVCRRSHDRGGRVVASDALVLPFADDAFDGVDDLVRKV